MAEQNLFPAGFNPFEGVEAAKAANRSNYATEGHYLTRIQSVKVTQSRNKIWFVVFTHQVIWADPFSMKEWESKGREPGKMPMAPMSEFQHLLKQTDDSFLGNMKAIVMALFDAKEDEVTKEILTEITGPANPLAGTLLELRVKQITTRAGNPFTKHDYLRAVPAAEVKSVLDAMGPEGKALIDRLYPDKGLDQLIAVQAAEAVQAAAEAATS